jgi:cytochrome c-type biogenesis protein CcmF
MIWHSHPELPIGFNPTDGASLNPLLQNPWMIIHPPIMFIGYSSTAVAFAFALNAMVTKKIHEWVSMARAWVIFATLTLGAGIILGGYWSYVTLGWGGYWAWDPVENASFVPWVIAAALLHGIIIQIRQKGLIRTNLFLAGLSFISVLWGSFLTRSGVLADFSVHSFADSDLNLYLITLVVFFTGIFFIPYFKTIRTVNSSKFAEGIFSRETFILIGLLTLLFTGITVFVGTSSPIITGLLGKASNVSIEFYHTISVPIAIFLLFSMAIAPILTWRVSQLRNLKTLGAGTVGAVLVTISGIIFGMGDFTSIFLLFLSSIAIFLNAYVFFQFLRKVPSKVGGYLSHVGIALMVIGIITSSMYDRSEKVTLPLGQYIDTDFGYKIQFVDFVKAKDGKDRVRLVVEKDGESYTADPQFYYSEYTKSYMLSPHVDMHLNKDIYISPISYMPSQKAEAKRIKLNKNATEIVDNMKITFNRFIVDDHVSDTGMMVKADLTVTTTQTNYEKQHSIQPSFQIQEGNRLAPETTIPETNYKVRIEEMDANTGSIVLSVSSLTSDENELKDVLAIEVSEKPFISILWLGTLIMLVGVVIAMLDRIKAPKL